MVPDNGHHYLDELPELGLGLGFPEIGLRFKISVEHFSLLMRAGHTEIGEGRLLESG